MDEEHSEPARAEKEEAEELRQEKPETSGTTQNIEVSAINTPVGSTTLSKQSNQSYQTIQSTITSSPQHNQIGNLGRSMADKMRLPIFRGHGSGDLDQH